MKKREIRRAENLQRRSRAAASEIECRRKDPIQAVKGFLCQWQQNPKGDGRFNPLTNQKAREVFCRLADASGIGGLVVARGFNLESLKNDVNDLLRINRLRTRELQAELALVR